MKEALKINEEETALIVIENKSKRKLNFELLRIVSMILIVMYHYSDWGGLLSIEGNVANKLIGNFLNLGGKLGVNLFILISGYFSINSKFKTKKLLKLMFEVWCYSVGILAVCFILRIGDLSKTNVIKSFLPISYNMYWFATAYVGMYILSPFINKFVKSIGQEKHKVLIIILGLFLSVIPTIFYGANMGCSDLVWFIYVYIIAAYIKLYNTEFTKKRRNYIFFAIIMAALLFGISVFCFALKGKIPFFSKLETYFNSMQILPMLLLSISVFMYFKNLNIEKSKVIEFLAKSSFAVYLIHINSSIRIHLFRNILRLQDFYNVNSILLIGYIIVTAIIIYLVCTLIETIRRKIIEEPLFKIKKFDKYFDKLDKKINF